ncbi:hypothetical protein CDAR_471501 [Caerostris darwini]|uniref:Uncharacterized protein n=1 Tax=Caerostris darwini TaxID=1538125 RepID=A0AAV4RL88_9ARAC|nr:hypothetical protein CDAR_471501 [Caerostris darwini]
MLESEMCCSQIHLMKIICYSRDTKPSVTRPNFILKNAPGEHCFCETFPALFMGANAEAVLGRGHQRKGDTFSPWENRKNFGHAFTSPFCSRQSLYIFFLSRSFYAKIYLWCNSEFNINTAADGILTTIVSPDQLAMPYKLWHV